MELIEWLIIAYIVGFMIVFLVAMNMSRSDNYTDEGRGEDNDYNRKSD